MYPNLSASLILIYLSLSFIYSIIEKVSNWEVCTSYYQDHFKNSLLKNHVEASVVLVLVYELVYVGMSSIGLIYLISWNDVSFAMYGFISIVITLLLLMTGQRIAQDYSGAMNITVYFILSVFGLYILENA